MTDLYNGSRIHLNEKRAADVTECANCHSLMVKVPRHKITLADISIIEKAGLKLADPELKKDLCPDCETVKI